MDNKKLGKLGNKFYCEKCDYSCRDNFNLQIHFKSKKHNRITMDNENKGKYFNCGNSKHSNFSIFSFHPIKAITTFEGGMITTNDKNLAERFDKLKNPPAVNRPEERDGFTEISMNHRFRSYKRS